MKLSRLLLLSIALFSVLPSAMAQGQLGTATWLKSSISAMRTEPAKAKYSSVCARPFVPNRYLPSEKELAKPAVNQIPMASAPQMAMPQMTQMSQIAQMPQQTMMQNQPVYEQAAMPSAPAQRAQRYLSDEQSSLLAEFKRLCKARSSGVRVPEPPVQLMRAQPSMQVPEPSQMESQFFVQAPNLSQNQEAELDRLVEANRPGNGNNIAGQSTARANFGAWHSRSGLPAAGFHSYLPCKNISYANHSASHSYTRSSKTHKQNICTAAPRNIRPAAQAAPTIACYPSYKTQYTF